ncbi:molybdopterin cofactor-binding domain-containing protein [Nocardia sp. NPDC057668]|uniref:xanthine dehydrogenase family protein molybdopterin-binding subunit n=1 Tax=Nocardia sp. NPDC057668 TaxID=3346202 RepID=UPI00366CA2AC
MAVAKKRSAGSVDAAVYRPGVERRRFLTYLLAAPTVTIAGRFVAEGEWAGVAGAAPVAAAGRGEIIDLGELARLGTIATAPLMVLTVGTDGGARFLLPRLECGQGIATGVAIMIAEELDLEVDRVEVQLERARGELVANQLTGGSTSTRALYDPVRALAATARRRLVQAAADRWGVAADSVRTEYGEVRGPGGLRLGYGELAGAAADRRYVGIVGAPKPEAEHTRIGKRHRRNDIHDIVTGRVKYTMDIAVAGARPTMVRRPPTVNGGVASFDERAVRAMPGVIDVAVISTGIAVVAETFGQAWAAKDAMAVEWTAGSIDERSDADIFAELHASTPAFVAPPVRNAALGIDYLEAEFDWAYVNHAPMETNCAIADVRADRAEIWCGLKLPTVARAAIAAELGLPADRVTVHVVQAGGSFGRRMYHDAALEACEISKALGMPVKLMWTRSDDMRHGRARPAMHHKLRAVLHRDKVVGYEQRVAAATCDELIGFDSFVHESIAKGLYPPVNWLASQALFQLENSIPYDLGLVSEVMNEVSIDYPTGMWRSVYSGPARGVEEIFMDEIADRIGEDPVRYRLRVLKDRLDKQVVEQVARVGRWTEPMPSGHARGLGFHAEYRSRTACLVEMDASDPARPRVTRAVIAVDAGTCVNPSGVENQLLGGLTDAISTVLHAGLHIEKGLALEGSYSQFHFARQRDSPLEVEFIHLHSGGPPGGVGELGVPAAVGAVANAYARATGKPVRGFPVLRAVDFTPFPR